MNPESLSFCPDWVSRPGETIASALEERNLEISVFANQLGQDLKFVQALIDGEIEITIRLAQKLVNVLGGSTAFWMAREAQYRKDLAKACPELDTKANSEWLAGLPLREMRSFGWLNPYLGLGNELKACLAFFDTPSVSAWQRTYDTILSTSAFRKSATFVSAFSPSAAWLRQGEIEAGTITTKPWNPQKFKAALETIRSLTKRKDPGHFIPELQKICADCGVAVVVVRAPNGCRASGATRFITPTKACILLSFRYLSDDHFWFTFFHEAAHLLLHGKDKVFLEDDHPDSAAQEGEANNFAANMLIPVAARFEFEQLGCNSKQVIRFAQKIGISSGIVVGQMQYFGLLDRRYLNGLKRRFSWGDSSHERQ